MAIKNVMRNRATGTDDAMGVAGGAASGASLGSFAGPIGTGIGALIGGLAGAARTAGPVTQLDAMRQRVSGVLDTVDKGPGMFDAMKKLGSYFGG